MAQHNHEHLTWTQLSAYLDQELPASEMDQCTTHMHTCQSCQAALADLRLTSALVRSMPQVEVPRSFVLPTNLAALPVTPTHGVQQTRRLSFATRTLRAVSTLAAVLGLILLLTGALTVLPHSNSPSIATNSVPASVNATHNPTQGSATTSRLHTPSATPSKHIDLPTLTRTPDQTPIPTSTSATPALSSPTSTQPPSSPLTLDLTQSTGRLDLGAILLLFGILGLFWAHRIQPRSTHDAHGAKGS